MFYTCLTYVSHMSHRGLAHVPHLSCCCANVSHMSPKVSHVYLGFLNKNPLQHTCFRRKRTLGYTFGAFDGTGVALVMPNALVMQVFDTTNNTYLFICRIFGPGSTSRKPKTSQKTAERQEHQNRTKESEHASKGANTETVPN